MSNANRNQGPKPFWTEDKSERLIEMRAGGLGNVEIAKILGCSQGSVQVQVWKLRKAGFVIVPRPSGPIPGCKAAPRHFERKPRAARPVSNEPRPIPHPDAINPDEARHAKIKKIIGDAAFWHGVDPALVHKGKFKGRWKKHGAPPPEVLARRDAIARIILTFPELSFPRVARIFSLDHTTVMHHARIAGLPPRKPSPNQANAAE